MGKRTDHMKHVVDRLGVEVGLKGGFVFLRGTWDARRRDYTIEQSRDGEHWGAWDHSASTFSIHYHGGPKDGQVEL